MSERDGVVLSVEDVTSGYGEINILKDVSLSVREREVVAILGPNGAGKTTLLRTIIGILTPSSGDIRFEGESTVGLPPESLIAKGIVYVPENRELFPRMTVEENLEMGATVRPDSLAANLDRVYGLFAQLAERRSQRAATLSGGEQQMLAIARGLMAEPDVLLLDEPSLGLAPQIVETVEQIIERIVDDGTSVLLVEQNADMALNASDWGYILREGEMQAGGPIDEIREMPFIKSAYL